MTNGQLLQRLVGEAVEAVEQHDPGDQDREFGSSTAIQKPNSSHRATGTSVRASSQARQMATESPMTWRVTARLSVFQIAFRELRLGERGNPVVQAPVRVAAERPDLEAVDNQQQDGVHHHQRDQEEDQRAGDGDRLRRMFRSRQPWPDRPTQCAREVHGTQFGF